MNSIGYWQAWASRNLLTIQEKRIKQRASGPSEEKRQLLRKRKKR